MELNLASSITHNIISSRDSCGQLTQGFNPRVQLRETRSAYFINVNLSGFRKEEIRLEMDNTRTLIIRGQRYLQDMGKVEWTWHLMESGGRSFRRPFKIPHNVNVAAMTGSFHQGVLHVLMPKFRWTSRFTPYHINRSDSQEAEPAHTPDISNVVQEAAKESGADPNVENVDGFMNTHSNGASKEADNDFTQKMDDLVRTHSNAAKDTDNDDAHQMDNLVGTHRNTADDDAVQQMHDLVGTENSSTDDQKSPEISRVEEEFILPQSMGLPEECSSGNQTHLQKEIKENDSIEEPQQQAVTAPGLDHAEHSCSGSTDQVGHNDKGRINVVQGMGHHVTDDQNTQQQQKDASSPPCDGVEEGLFCHQEAVAPPLNSEGEVENNHEKREAEKMNSSNVNDGIISLWNDGIGEAFWSRTKIVVSVVVSSVVIMAAFKIMRR